MCIVGPNGKLSVSAATTVTNNRMTNDMNSSSFGHYFTHSRLCVFMWYEFSLTQTHATAHESLSNLNTISREHRVQRETKISNYDLSTVQLKCTRCYGRRQCAHSSTLQHGQSVGRFNFISHLGTQQLSVVDCMAKFHAPCK